MQDFGRNHAEILEKFSTKLFLMEKGCHEIIVAIFYQDFQAKNKLNAKNQNRFKGAMRIVLTEALFLHQDSNLDHQHGPYLIGNDAPR